MVLDASSFAGFLIDPGPFDLKALGNLGWSEYFIHLLLHAKRCQREISYQTSRESLTRTYDCSR
jgi:hypothetical protein